MIEHLRTTLRTAALKLKALPRHMVLQGAFLLLAPFVIVLCCQTISLQGGGEALLWIGGRFGAAALTAWLLLCLLVLLYGLLRLLSAAYLLTAIVPLALTLVSYYKMVINGEPLMLTDFSLAGQFGDVAGFAMDRISISSATGAALFFLLLLLVLAIVLDVKAARWPWKRGLCLAGTGALLLAASLMTAGQTYCVRQYENYATQAERNAACGVPLGLLSTYLGSRVNGSEEYGELHMRQLLQEMLQTLPAEEAGEQPHIIFVMNESFFDVTRLPNVTFDADPLANYHRLSDESSCGRFYTITCGGGTGWVEMEAFTGVAKDLLPASQANTDLTAAEYEQLPSFVRVLQENGYGTIAFHAHTDEMYNRAENYPHIGFEEVLFLEDYQETGTYEGGYFDDNSSADVIISLFEENRQKPTFLYTMTMQNHQPYYAGRYTENRVTVASDRLSEEELEVLQCYINGVYDADQMLGRLVEYFSAVEEPVILVFAGDHLPSMYLTDEESVYSKLGYVGSASSADWSPAEYQEMLSTDYLLWTNFGAETARGDTSCTAIGAQLLHYAGADVTPYYAWQYQNSRELLLFHTGNLWIGPDGKRLVPDEALEQYWRDWGDVVYDLLYGEGYLAGEVNRVRTLSP